MAKRKSLQELTIKDNFMFGAVMLDPENCRRTIERILGVPIERVEVDREKSIVFHPKYKGVRFDAEEQDDEFVSSLKEAVKKVKESREMGALYMIWEEEIEEAFAEGKQEGEILKLVSQIQKKLDKGQSVEQIAEDLVEDVQVIQTLIKEHL